MKLILENERPFFALFTDDNQWVIAMWKGERERRGKKVVGYNNYSYFPTITLLFDYLSESLFRKLTKRNSGWQGIAEAVDKVYRLLDKIDGQLKMRRVTVAQDRRKVFRHKR